MDSKDLPEEKASGEYYLQCYVSYHQKRLKKMPYRLLVLSNAVKELFSFPGTGDIREHTKPGRPV